MSEDIQGLQLLPGAAFMGYMKRRSLVAEGSSKGSSVLIKVLSHFSTVHALSHDVSDFNYVHAALCTGLRCE